MNENRVEPSMEAKDLLLAEYKHFSDSMWKNEEQGERRVKFFITLVTAVMAALVTLWTKPVDAALSEQSVLMITVAALGTLLMFGVVTFMRMIQRNYVTEEFKKVLKYIRKNMAQLAELNEYAPPLRSSGYLFKGGLAPTMALMNSVLGALITWLVLPTPLFATAAFVSLLLAHAPFIAKRNKSKHAK